MDANYDSFLESFSLVAKGVPILLHSVLLLIFVNSLRQSIRDFLLRKSSLVLRVEASEPVPDYARA